MQEEIRIIGIEGIPEVESGDDIATLIIDASKRQGLDIMDNDIIVVTHKIVSKAEGRIVDLKKVSPSEFALKISKGRNKDSRMVEVILREAKKIVRIERGVIIA